MLIKNVEQVITKFKSLVPKLSPVLIKDLGDVYVIEAYPKDHIKDKKTFDPYYALHKESGQIAYYNPFAEFDKFKNAKVIFGEE